MLLYYLHCHFLQYQYQLDVALKAFGFTCDDIKNEKIFNKKSISKTYRQLAKAFHPDVRGGNETKFREIHGYYGILLAMVEPNDTDNDKNAQEHRDDVQKLVKAIMLS